MEAHLERGRDAEVAAAAAQRPEEVGVLVGARGDDRAVGRDDLGPEQAVGREAMLAREPPHTAAERVAGDADGRRRAGEGREAARRGRSDDGAPLRARADARDPPIRVDEDRRHRRRVHDDPAIERHERPVARGLNGKREVVLAGDEDGAADVGRTRCGDDDAVALAVQFAAKLALEAPRGRGGLGALGHHEHQDRRRRRNSSPDARDQCGWRSFAGIFSGNWLSKSVVRFGCAPGACACRLSG
jgi:hypothetical protein